MYGGARWASISAEALLLADELRLPSPPKLGIPYSQALMSVVRSHLQGLSAGKVEHTKDADAAHRRLRDSKELAIYVTDGCPPGKQSGPLSYATECLAADPAAVIMVICCMQQLTEIHGQATASPSAALRGLCGSQRGRQAGSYTFMCQCWGWRSSSP